MGSEYNETSDEEPEKAEEPDSWDQSSSQEESEIGEGQPMGEITNESQPIADPLMSKTGM